MKHPSTVVLIILAVWMAAQSIGLIVVEHYGVTDLPTGVERPDIDATGVIWYLIAGIALGTILVLLLARFKQQRLWTVWFSLAVFILSYVALAAFLPVAGAVVAAALFVWFKTDIRLHWIVRNIPELFLYAGIAAVFVPLLSIEYALIILALISIYDIIAVWRSKHMISLARFQIESGRFAGFSMPSISVGKPTRVKTKKTRTKRTPAAHEHHSAILGGGDFAFPLLYSGTVLLAFGWPPALGATIGGYLGLLGLFSYSHKNRFYPAMPFLALGLVIGTMVALLIT
jgi:presenilin-like A22 family membrane protease